MTTAGHPAAQSSLPRTTSSDQTTPSRRRKPRKLNREASSTVTKPPVIQSPPPDVKNEISVLRNRVNEIETLVQDLLTQRRDEPESAAAPAAAPKKSARRRQRRKKKAEGEQETEQEELERLKEDLRVAGEELATLKQSGPERVEEVRRGRKERSESRDDSRDDIGESDVEEIRRDSTPGGTRNRPGTSRAVTFSGSYRIPLPTNVSDQDVRAVQRGLSSVQNIARNFMQQSREDPGRLQAMNGMEETLVQNPTLIKFLHFWLFWVDLISSLTPSLDPQPTRSGSGWSSWFGGYTIGVARFVNNIEIEPPLEPTTASGARQSLRPARANSAPGTRRKPPKLRVAGQRVAEPSDKGLETLKEKQIRGLLA